jgi:hypothetical protein
MEDPSRPPSRADLETVLYADTRGGSDFRGPEEKPRPDHIAPRDRFSNQKNDPDQKLRGGPVRRFESGEPEFCRDSFGGYEGLHKAWFLTPPERAASRLARASGACRNQ